MVTTKSSHGMWSGLEGMTYRLSLEQIQSRGGSDDSTREAGNTEKGIFFCVCVCACHFVMTMPCVRRDASSVISVALIQRERDGE
jgi:hypothetical protein